MGLDIYLSKIQSIEKWQALEDQYEERSTLMWAKYPSYAQFSEDEKKEIWAALKDYAASLGLDEDGSRPEERIEITSKVDPEHLFKIGYFRSSYNNSGINNVLRYKLNSSLYDLIACRFLGAHQEGYAVVDWEETRRRCQDCISAYRAEVARLGGDYRVLKFTQYDAKSGIDSDEAAYQEFTKAKQGRSGFDSYTSSQGFFSLKEPLEIAAAFCGNGGDEFGVSTVRLVYKADDGEWICAALEIIIETCRWVLEKEDRKDYYLYWSP